MEDRLLSLGGYITVILISYYCPLEVILVSVGRTFFGRKYCQKLQRTFSANMLYNKLSFHKFWLTSGMSLLRELPSIASAMVQIPEKCLRGAGSDKKCSLSWCPGVDREQNCWCSTWTILLRNHCRYQFLMDSYDHHI